MIGRALSKFGYVSAWLLFLVALVVPGAFLFERCVVEAAASGHSFSFSTRQITILLRTIGLAGGGALLACLLSVPAAICIGHARSALAKLLIALLLMELLCPPIVYAFGWERLLPRGINPYTRCVLVWGLWSWPVPAAVIGAAYARMGASAHEAALLDVGRVRAFCEVVLPALRIHVVGSFLILFVLLMSDTAIPSACALIVFSTELMAQASSSTRLIDVAWPSLLVVAPTWAMVFILWRLRGAAAEGETDEQAESRRPSILIVGITVLIFFVGAIVPLWSLCAKQPLSAAIQHALAIYGTDIFWSLVTCAAAGVLVALGGLLLGFGDRHLKCAAICALLGGALPGALVGAALIAAYNRSWLSAIYDHWPIVTLCYVAKLGWIGGGAGYAVVRARRTGLLGQAAMDGAGDAAQLWRVAAPAHSRMLLACVIIVTALSVGEAAASDLVRVPSFQTVASILIEKFHRFEDGMVVGITLVIVGLVVLASILLALWPISREHPRTLNSR